MKASQEEGTANTHALRPKHTGLFEEQQSVQFMVDGWGKMSKGESGWR